MRCVSLALTPIALRTLFVLGSRSWNHPPHCAGGWGITYAGAGLARPVFLKRLAGNG